MLFYDARNHEPKIVIILAFLSACDNVENNEIGVISSTDGGGESCVQCFGGEP
jgi:hypothetical protein